ncbi:hypothetical protein NL676_008067 [Syzygium grande]|nr:hypothetical protein NL676_008067 [Syzygium grande]
MIPDECQVIIQACPKLGETPGHGMFYKDYRGDTLVLIKSDSDTSTSNRMDKVAKMEEKSQAASIENDVGTDDQGNHIMSLMNIDDKDRRIIVKFIGDCFDCFASGSRIIVTTRNSVVLEESPQIRTYHVSRLDNDQAFQLFRQHASIPTSPSCSNLKLLDRALNAMAGNPLFIEVMGAVSNESLTDPGRRSRIYNHEIALHTIKRKKGTEMVEALCLNLQFPPDIGELTSLKKYTPLGVGVSRGHSERDWETA